MGTKESNIFSSLDIIIREKCQKNYLSRPTCEKCTMKMSNFPKKNENGTSKKGVRQVELIGPEDTCVKTFSNKTLFQNLHKIIRFFLQFSS